MIALKIIGILILMTVLIFITVIVIYAQNIARKERKKAGIKTNLERNIEELEKIQPGAGVFVKTVGILFFIILFTCIFLLIYAPTKTPYSDVDYAALWYIFQR